MTLYHQAADMLERYGRVNGVMHCEVSMLIAELRAAAALDELVRENERLGLYDDQRPVAWRCRDYVTGCWFISVKPDPAGSIAGESVPLYPAPAPAQLDSDVYVIVHEQANDDGLWFAAKTAPEAYLQQELRRLHAAIEAGPGPELTLDYVAGHKDGCEWSAQVAVADNPLTGDWLYDDPYELAEALRKGPDNLIAPPPAPAQPRQPLSDEQIVEIMNDGYNCRYNDWSDHIEFARAIERAITGDKP